MGRGYLHLYLMDDVNTRSFHTFCIGIGYTDGI